MAARINYLGLDRPDLQYPIKEACRGMANPLVRHARMVKRVGRYLVGAPRLIWEFPWQGLEDIDTYTDSDWAGCRRTARSTSGGAIMRGRHCLRTWSVTQKRVTLSSAEAELGAAVKASSETIGILQLAVGLGRKIIGRVHVDSSAALGVVARRGNGKLRHVRVGMLWVQQLAEAGELEYRKVLGTCNPADLLTKHQPAAKIVQYLELLGQHTCGGRAVEGLQANSCSLARPSSQRRNEGDEECNTVACQCVYRLYHSACT